jgi:hypothetical protein
VKKEVTAHILNKVLTIKQIKLENLRFFEKMLDEFNLFFSEGGGLNDVYLKKTTLRLDSLEDYNTRRISLGHNSFVYLKYFIFVEIDFFVIELSSTDIKNRLIFLYIARVLLDKTSEKVRRKGVRGTFGSDNPDCGVLI